MVKFYNMIILMKGSGNFKMTHLPSSMETISLIQNTLSGGETTLENGIFEATPWMEDMSSSSSKSDSSNPLVFYLYLFLSISLLLIF